MSGGAARRWSALVNRRIRLIVVPCPYLTRQSALEPTRAVRVVARIETAHDQQGRVRFASAD
jgi:hypothetical protein